MRKPQFSIRAGGARALNPRNATEAFAGWWRVRRSLRARSRHRDQLFTFGLMLGIVVSAVTDDATVALVTAGVALGGCRTSIYSFNGPLLQVAYRGWPVTCELSKVTDTMGVPVRRNDEHLDDVATGELAARLFYDALAAGAITAPAGLRLKCYSDDDERGSGIILAAFPESTDQPGVGLTTGWLEAHNVSAHVGQNPRDPALVAAALKFFARELNTALQWR